MPRVPAGALALTTDRHAGPAQSSVHAGPERGHVRVARGPQAWGQAHSARETGADHPYAFMAHSGWHTIEGQEAPTLRLGEALEPLRVLERETEPCILALHEGRARAWSPSPPVVDSSLRDCRAAAGLCVTSPAHTGEAIEAACRFGEGQTACGFRTRGLTTLRAVEVEAAAHLQREPHHGLQGRESTVGVGSGPHWSATAGAVTDERQQGLGRRGRGTGCGTRHRHHLQAPVLPMVSV